jgi:lysophospholipase L1-like esterase
MSIKGFNINGNIEKYDYESLENKPISLKNGGNVVINEDGTMTAPESEVTDEQVSSAVSDWIEANPDKVTTVQDGSITQEKLSDELIEKLGLELNHHLTEVKITVRKSVYNSFWDGVSAGSSGTSTELFETPQYIKIVNNHTCDIKAFIRFADILDYENANFITNENSAYIHQVGYLQDTIPMGEEIIFPTFEWGSKTRKYIQLRFQPSAWSGAWNNIEIYAYYDNLKPSYKIPNDEESKEIFLEDLPMEWVVSSSFGSTYSCVYCAVPYYPDFTYHIRGGHYENSLIKALDVYGIYDDISVFDTLQKCIIGQGSYIPNINAFPLSKFYGNTIQYDTSVNGGADANYQWAYFKTPAEEELTGLKWLLIPFSKAYGSDGVCPIGNNLTEEIVDYVFENNTLFNGKLQYQYISRWQDKDTPRKHTTILRKVNPNLNDDGSIYQSFNTMNEFSPMANSNWVLFGDSLTDSYGGHDRASEYFASKIANEFNMNLDNRAKSGSNIYKGGSGNYVSVSGIVMLDEYLAEIEAGTTEQADYITVAFGTNTFKTDMGTNEDTSETYTSSVYGATKYFIEKIREKVPNAVLGFVLSPRQNWGNADAQKLRDVDGAREAIKTVCEEYGVPYIDMSTQSGITVDMLPDGIHIKNDQSQKLYYHAMRRFMMGL